MANKRIIGLDKLATSLRAFFKSEFTDTTTLAKLAIMALKRIQATTRSGYTMAIQKSKDTKSGRKFKKTKLHRLSDSYIAMRQGAVTFRTNKNGERIAIQEPDERLKHVDKEFFTPDLSNLTFSGQLLRSLVATAKKGADFAEIFIRPEGNRRKLPGEKKSLTNQKVAEYVAAQGRPFLGIDDDGIEVLKRELVRSLRKQLKRLKLK
jgi:hypothetical protein